jgi:hypothetical protein
MGLLRARPKLISALAVLALFAAGAAYQAIFGSAQAAGLHVEGNELVDHGHVVRLLGVDWAGTDDECARSGTPIAGRSDAAAVRAVRTWRGNAVRVPLNADCWLGLGARYRSAITAFVARLHAERLYVVLALDRPGGRMPAADRAARFWREVAQAFKRDHQLVLDLYGEPRDVDWFCWRDGCRDPAGGPRLAGMQLLVDSVRETGAKQPLLVGGLDRANDLGSWLDRVPADPEGQLVASFHTSDATRCATVGCWDATVARVAEEVPVVTDALGRNGCDAAFLERFAAWADAHGVSYLGGAWKPGPCDGGSLISGYAGTPTRAGLAVKRHLVRLWGRDETLRLAPSP